MIIPLLALLLAQPVPAAVPDYVPDSGWSDDEWARTFYEKWYGGQLAAMGEPPLATEADLQGFRERLRLLVLPTFGNGFAYRIDVRTDGAAVLRWARLSGRGGYAPGTLAREGTRPLSRSELKSVRSAVAAADLAHRSRKWRVPEKVNRDGSTTITVCADGTALVFEQLTARGRIYVTRSCGIERPVQRLADRLVRLMPRKHMD